MVLAYHNALSYDKRAETAALSRVRTATFRKRCKPVAYYTHLAALAKGNHDCADKDVEKAIETKQAKTALLLDASSCHSRR